MLLRQRVSSSTYRLSCPRRPGWSSRRSPSGSESPACCSRRRRSARSPGGPHLDQRYEKTEQKMWMSLNQTHPVNSCCSCSGRRVSYRPVRTDLHQSRSIKVSNVTLIIRESCWSSRYHPCSKMVPKMSLSPPTYPVYIPTTSCKLQANPP